MCKCVLETMSSKFREHAQAHVAPFAMFLSLVLALHATARAPAAYWYIQANSLRSHLYRCWGTVQERDPVWVPVRTRP